MSFCTATWRQLLQSNLVLIHCNHTLESLQSCNHVNSHSIFNAACTLEKEITIQINLCAPPNLFKLNKCDCLVKTHHNLIFFSVNSTYILNEMFRLDFPRRSRHGTPKATTDETIWSQISRIKQNRVKMGKDVWQNHGRQWIK